MIAFDPFCIALSKLWTKLVKILPRSKDFEPYTSWKHSIKLRNLSEVWQIFLHCVPQLLNWMLIRWKVSCAQSWPVSDEFDGWKSKPCLTWCSRHFSSFTQIGSLARNHACSWIHQRLRIFHQNPKLVEKLKAFELKF